MKVQEVINAALFDFPEQVDANDFSCGYGSSRTVLRSAERECVAWFIRPGLGAAFVFLNGKGGYNANHFCRQDFVQPNVGAFNELDPVRAMEWIKEKGGVLVVPIEDVERKVRGEKVGRLEFKGESMEGYYCDAYVLYRWRNGDVVGYSTNEKRGATFIDAKDIVGLIDSDVGWECEVGEKDMQVMRARVLGANL